MIETFNRKNSDRLGRYYTNKVVSDLLIRSMNLDSPSSILDLGSGNYSLSNMAKSTWENATIYSVDIDDKKFNNSAHNHQHYLGDALDHNLSELIGIGLETFDAAVCNPPYIRPSWKEHFKTILEDAKLDSLLSASNVIGADILFIAQNLRFLKTNGRLGLIIPDGIISGKRNSKFREVLISNHSIEKVIELPRKIFDKTDAKAHILILTKLGKSPEKIELSRLNDDGGLAESLFISTDEAICRMDYSYSLANRNLNTQNSLKLSECVEAISRGNISSSEIRKLDIKIFHSTCFGGNQLVNQSFSINEPELLKHVTHAKKDDILLCRVGRNAHKKVATVQNDYVHISDCIIKITPKVEFRRALLCFLLSDAGSSALQSITHGVGASHFTIDDVKNIRIPLED
jgi:type I restriction enzyme M protein